MHPCINGTGPLWNSNATPSDHAQLHCPSFPFDVILRVTEQSQFNLLSSYVDKDMLWSSWSLLDPEMEVKWAWILLKGAICMLLLASQNMQSPFSPLTQEDRSRARRKRIFCKHCPRWIMSCLPSVIFLQLSTVTTTHAVVLVASCWQILMSGLQRSAKRRGCLLSYSQAEPGRELTQPRKHLLAKLCTYRKGRCVNYIHVF